MTSLEKECYIYLEDLRRSGVTNMYGAGSYLVSTFDISKERAKEILKYWMDNYKELSYLWEAK